MAFAPVNDVRLYYEEAGSGTPMIFVHEFATMRQVQMKRPSIYELGERMTQLTVPTLIITGDEDDACLEPALYMKRTIRTSGLVVIPKSGHTINLEEPDMFNRCVLDFVTTVEAGRWTPRNPASLSRSAILLQTNS
jgi:alpha-beta hydrolase superfamily lysophospholipase